MDKHSRRADEGEFDDPPLTSPPIAPDGGIAVGFVGHPLAVPARTPENFVCLRGPCRHYWHLVTMSDAGNPAETFEELGLPEPRQHHHMCLVNPGYETEFTDDNAYDCNKWDPYAAHELADINQRRAAYAARAQEYDEEHEDDAAE